MKNQCCLVLLLASLVMAGEPRDTAGIDGFVTSDVVAVLPEATVGIDSLTRAFHRQTLTNTSGYYLLDELQPGQYSVWAEVPGYGCITYPRVVVFPSRRVRQDFHFVRAKRYPGNCEPL